MVRHEDTTYWPEVQTLQVVQVAALVEVEYDDPVEHGVHTVSAVALHALLTRFPALQVEQFALEAGVVQKLLAGHALSTTVPVGHQLPGAHCTWVDVLVHT